MMNIILWVCQGLLGMVFLYSGVVKSTQRREKIIEMGQTGVTGLSYPVIRFIGISELLGVAGIILPTLLGIAKILTPIAAICFAVIMVLAARKHLQLKEPKTALGNCFLLIISLLIAIMRLQELS